MPIPSGLVFAALGVWAAVAVTGSPAWSADNPLDRYRDRCRVLLVAAPSEADPMLRRQRALFDAMHAGARERDLVLVEAVGATPSADRLRAIYDLDPSVFTAVLVGKDGGAKLRSATAFGPDDLFPTIDAMPMRRQEMQRRAP